MYNEAYLQRFIDDRIEESLHLDYKAADALSNASAKKDISKDVSSFANSDGGVIIYGLREGKDDNHLAISVDPIDRKKITKEWLEQVIQSNIQPRIEGIEIYPIEIDRDRNKVVYVVNIPKSATAHQASDKRYYKRFNFLSEAMYDYEVKDILNRPKNPLITLKFVLTQYEESDAYNLAIYAINEGSVLAKYINCSIQIPVKHIKGYENEYGREVVNLMGSNTVRERTGEIITLPQRNPQIIYGPSRYNPLLPKMECKLKLPDIQLTKHYRDCNVLWTIYADNSEPKSGATNMSSVHINYE